MTGRVYFKDEAWDLKDLESRGGIAAAALAAAGVQRGTVVALLLPNSPVWIEALTAIRCLHAVRLPLPTHLSTPELSALCWSGAAQVLIADGEQLRQNPTLLVDCPHLRVITVGEAPGDPRGTDIPLRWEEIRRSGHPPMALPSGSAQVVSLSSGSMGIPRVHQWQGPQVWERWHGRSAEERPPIRTSIVTAPLYSASQYGSLCLAWRKRANIVILPEFSPVAFLAAVERHQVNHAYLVPHHFTQLLRLPARALADCSTLDHVVHTGGSCPVQVKQAMIEWWGPVIWEAYGATDAPTISVVSSHEWLQRPGTVGHPRVGVKVVDAQGKPLPEGRVGRVLADVAGLPAVRINGALRSSLSNGSNDFLDTGDTGYLDEQGYLYITGRQADVLSLGSRELQPLQMEHAVIAHPKVLDCAVWAVPSDRGFLQVSAAVQVLQPEASLAEECRQILQQYLPPSYAVPRVLQSVEPFRLATGKLNRMGLARQFELRI